MAHTWVLVANASQAVLYLNEGPGKGLQKLRELTHEASRRKSGELVSDRPGHNTGHGTARGAYEPAKTPKEIEADRFAGELAHELAAGRAQHAYQRLVLVASPHFMGRLKQHLDLHVQQLVTAAVEKDYTKATPRELAGHLQDYVFA